MADTVREESGAAPYPMFPPGIQWGKLTSWTKESTLKSIFRVDALRDSSLFRIKERYES